MKSDSVGALRSSLGDIRLNGPAARSNFADYPLELTSSEGPEREMPLEKRRSDCETCRILMAKEFNICRQGSIATEADGG